MSEPSASCRTRRCCRPASSSRRHAARHRSSTVSLAAFGWLRTQGAQVVNVSANLRSSHALVESLRALQLKGALVVAAAGNGGARPAGKFPASQPGVLAVGALAPGSSTQVWKGSSRGPFVDLVAPAAGIRVLATSAPDQSASNETALTEEGTSFAAPLVTGAAAMLWATHRDWTAAEVANALVRSATPLGRGAPSPNWGYGRLDVSLALRTRLLSDSHEPNDWVAAALAQRPLRPGAEVVASLGWAGDTIDAYRVDVPAGRTARAVLRQGGQGLTMRVLPIGASDTQLDAVARMRPGDLPGRSERGQLAAGRRPRSGPGAPTRSCSRGSPAAPAAERGPLRVSGRRPGLRVREPTTR